MYSTESLVSLERFGMEVLVESNLISVSRYFKFTGKIDYKTIFSGNRILSRFATDAKKKTVYTRGG